MIVAVIAVGVMEAAVDDVVDVVAVRHGFMPTAGSVHVAGFVPVRGIGASFGIGRAHFKAMLFHYTVLALVVKMTVVDVVNMVTVLDGGVPTIRAVLMIVGFVAGRIFTHNPLSIDESGVHHKSEEWVNRES